MRSRQRLHQSITIQNHAFGDLLRSVQSGKFALAAIIFVARNTGDLAALDAFRAGKSDAVIDDYPIVAYNAKTSTNVSAERSLASNLALFVVLIAREEVGP